MLLSITINTTGSVYQAKLRTVSIVTIFGLCFSWHVTFLDGIDPVVRDSQDIDKILPDHCNMTKTSVFHGMVSGLSVNSVVSQWRNHKIPQR